MKCHLWNEQQAQSHSHSQMSVSKEQHEHPVGVKSRHHREPAERASTPEHLTELISESQLNTNRHIKTGPGPITAV